MILLDTGVLVAALNRPDERHEQGVALLKLAASGRYGQMVSTDYVLAEGLTLIQNRFRNRTAAESYASLFHGAADAHEAVLSMRHTPPHILEQAVEMHFQYYDRGLSVTDCTLVLHARGMEAVLATFDSGFDGLVGVVRDGKPS